MYRRMKLLQNINATTTMNIVQKAGSEIRIGGHRWMEPTKTHTYPTALRILPLFSPILYLLVTPRRDTSCRQVFVLLLALHSAHWLRQCTRKIAGSCRRWPAPTFADLVCRKVATFVPFPATLVQGRSCRALLIRELCFLHALSRVLLSLT